MDDLDAPVGGNPDGDLTVQAFLDYNCPYCKTAEPELRRFLDADQEIRLVYRDWPILSAASTLGAQLALAARDQGAYEAAHRSFMAIRGRTTSDALAAAVRGAGADIDRLEADQRRHAHEIAALLKRNADDAKAYGLQAVPAFMFGPIKVGAGFYVENFQAFAARARALRSRREPVTQAL